MFENYNDVLTVQEVMELLYCGKNTVYDLLNRGELKGFRLRHTWKIPKTSLIQYIEQKCSAKTR